MKDLCDTYLIPTFAKEDLAFDLQPLTAADPWVASSALQKAIRRGDVEIARRAALRLYQLRRSAIWRRFVLIAFEDVGVASVTALLIAAASIRRSWRERAGGDQRVILCLSRILAEAPKDRSSDYLICAAKKLAVLEHVREKIGESKPCLRLEMLAEKNLPLTTRAVAAWYASGIEWGDERRVGKGDLPGLLRTFQDLGVREALVEATQIAATVTREPICVMVPLIWLIAFDGQYPQVVDHLLPPTPVVHGVPLCAFDKHTRIGKAAIRAFAGENEAVRRCLGAYVPDFRALKALEMTSYYTDAAPVLRRLDWNGSAELERLGTEADMLEVGVPLEGIDPLLHAARDNLDHLNMIRARLFTRGKP